VNPSPQAVALIGHSLLRRFKGQHWPAIAHAHERAFSDPAGPWRAVAAWLTAERLPPVDRG
jgi:hypothetical protein